MRLKHQIVVPVMTASLLVGAVSAMSATVAIIDSGVDHKHEALSAHMWSNSRGSTTDGDGTTYKDDLHGWNFAENNNQIIDYKYVGTFSRDCYRMIEIQGRILRGIATDEEKAWYKSKREDQTFLKEMQKFGNFIHGTHVSGITTDQSDAAEVVGLKLIPTETPGALFDQAMLGQATFDARAGNPLVTMMLGMIAKRQATLLVKVGKYTKAVEARVANGSFGTSVAAVKPIVAQLVEQFTGSKPTDAEVEEYSRGFVDAIVKECAGFPAASPNTLFVFAAGNDGTDNDLSPVSPANIKVDNTIAVAATLGSEKLASFSNWGLTKVEVAAPGVVIRASIPGNEYIELSGTSMAAPYVTNVAARVQEANPSLNPAGVKKILVDTVDKKDWLKSKVSSGGIVNDQRALAAAELSKTMSLEAAIASARQNVADLVNLVGSDITADVEKDLLVLPMPSLFQ